MAQPVTQHDHDHDHDHDVVPSGRATYDAAVTGMDCTDCARTIEASLVTVPGVHSSAVNFIRGSIRVEYDPGHVDVPALKSRIGALGYGVDDRPTSGVKSELLFDVGGMDCGECAKTIEAGVARVPGVAGANVNFATATLRVTPANGTLDVNAIQEMVRQAGYSAVRRETGATVGDRITVPWWRQRRVAEVIVAALLWLSGFTAEQLGASMIFYAVPFVLSMVLAGYPVARAGLFAVRARRADMNVLMTVAAVGAVAIGEWDEGASVLILFAIGLTLQNLTLERTRRAIQALVKLVPAEALVRRSGADQRVPVEQVAIGETVIVRPGDRIPVDGTVTLGTSAVDQASITGESVPVAATVQSSVYAGSINGDGLLEIGTTKPASDTTLARIIHMVEEAQGTKAPAQAFVDRFAAIYTPVVIAAALVLALIVPIFAGDFQDWLFKALVLLVVACPCALVISTPVALVAAIGSASRRGVLFKGGMAIEALASVRAIAFDKTGTLTAGRPAVTDVIPFAGQPPEVLLGQAWAVEQYSTHPIARAIASEATAWGLRVPSATNARNTPGQGAHATIAGETILVGSRRLFGSFSERVEAQLQEFEADGKTAVLIGTTSQVMGIIAVADPVRPQSSGAVAELARLDLQTVMLTGDNRRVADRIGAAVGVSSVQADLLPEDKVAAIVALQRRARVAMIGDGVNDAPALVRADVGIAMGEAGTDVAVEAADVALMSDDLRQVPVAVRLSRRTMAIIRQNITVSILIKAVFLALTFAGATNLWLAVLADTGMAVLVTLNSLRLLQSAPPTQATPTAPSAPLRSTPAFGAASGVAN